VAGLTIAYQGDMKLYTVYNLIGMAGFFRAEAKPTTSAALLAAAAGIAESIGLKIEPELQEPYDQALAAIRKELSQGDFQSAWGAGKNMDLERTVQYASED
jgi:hypothetical protein